LIVIGLLAVGFLAAGGLFVAGIFNPSDSEQAAVPSPTATSTAAAATATVRPPETATPVPPAMTPTEPAPTATEPAPTATETPADTPAPTETVTPTSTPTPATILFQRNSWPNVTYDDVADATISQWSPNVNDGDNEICRVDGDDPSRTGNDLNTLISWDVSLVPVGSRVTEAIIGLTVFNRSVSTYQFYEVRRPWLEDEVTWNNASDGDPWQVPGVKGAEDRDATLLGELAPDEVGLYEVELNADALAVVQGWVDDPSSNHGFIITGTSSNDGVDFYCSEYEEFLERPQLTITYIDGGQ
jgi:hypothetical protein